MANPPNRIGRPSLDPGGKPSVHIAARVTPREFDRLYQYASRHRLNMAEALRQGLRELLEKDRAP